MATTSDLRSNPRNPRKISDQRLLMLKKSLDEFGDLGGVVVNTRTGSLISGHQRVKAIGLTAPGTIEYTERFPIPDAKGTVALGLIRAGDHKYAYREVDWPIEKELSAGLAANRSAGDFSIPDVADILRDLRDFDLDLDLTMMDGREREKFMATEAAEDGEGPNKDGKGREMVCPACGEEFEA